MRSVALSMIISLDGFIAGPERELDWMIGPDPEREAEHRSHPAPCSPAMSPPLTEADARRLKHPLRQERLRDARVPRMPVSSGSW